MLYKQSHMIVYDIGNNRWCGNIQRQHKSNHVYYIADFKFKILYQKCHDPDCVNFRSVDIPIPDELNPNVMESDEIIEDFDISADEELNQLFSDKFNNFEKLSPVTLDNQNSQNNSTSSELSHDEVDAFINDDFDVNVSVISNVGGKNSVRTTTLSNTGLQDTNSLDFPIFDPETFVNIEKPVLRAESKCNNDSLNTSEVSFGENSIHFSAINVTPGVNKNHRGSEEDDRMRLRDMTNSFQDELINTPSIIDLTKEDDNVNSDKHDNNASMDLFSENESENNIVPFSEADNDSANSFSESIDTFKTNKLSSCNSIKAIDRFILNDLFSDSHDDSLLDAI